MVSVTSNGPSMVRSNVTDGLTDCHAQHRRLTLGYLADGGIDGHRCGVRACRAATSAADCFRRPYSSPFALRSDFAQRLAHLKEVPAHSLGIPMAIPAIVMVRCELSAHAKNRHRQPT
jgi:hypothetical protein